LSSIVPVMEKYRQLWFTIGVLGWYSYGLTGVQ